MRTGDEQGTDRGDVPAPETHVHAPETIDEKPETEPADIATSFEKRHVKIHSGLPEMIHALGPEPIAAEHGPEDLEPVALVFELPARFDPYVARDNLIELDRMLLDILGHAGYEVKPVRGDVEATRGNERLLLRVLPWDRTYATVGMRTVDRFVADFDRSGATDGICLSEAAMPPEAIAAEAGDDGLWFVGRHRLARLLESLDAALTLGPRAMDSREDRAQE